MKPTHAYFRFTLRNGQATGFPALRWRWLKLPTDEELHLGFAGGRVVVLRGRRLTLLVQPLAQGLETEIQELPERHADDGGWAVTKIEFEGD